MRVSLLLAPQGGSPVKRKTFRCRQGRALPLRPWPTGETMPAAIGQNSSAERPWKHDCISTTITDPILPAQSQSALTRLINIPSSTANTASFRHPRPLRSAVPYVLPTFAAYEVLTQLRAMNTSSVIMALTCGYMVAGAGFEPATSGL